MIYLDFYSSAYRNTRTYPKQKTYMMGNYEAILHDEREKNKQPTRTYMLWHRDLNEMR